MKNISDGQKISIKFNKNVLAIFQSNSFIYEKIELIRLGYNETYYFFN